MPEETPPKPAPKRPAPARHDPAHEAYQFQKRIPDGDEHERMVCDTCGWVHYVNPKIVVGSLILWQDKVLLARRAIEPRKGYWTLPAGFLEERETTEAGAAREAYEEATADIAIRALLAVYDVPHISQVQVMFLADLKSPEVEPGIESSEVRLFEFADIPWKELAFPSVVWALRQYESLKAGEAFLPFRNPDPTDPRFTFHL